LPHLAANQRAERVCGSVIPSLFVRLRFDESLHMARSSDP